MTPSGPVELISGARIDETTKGFPALDRSVPILEVEAEGWTIDDLAPPFCALRRSALDHNLGLMAAYGVQQRDPNGTARQGEHGAAALGRQLAAGAWGMTPPAPARVRVMRAAGLAGADRERARRSCIDPMGRRGPRGRTRGSSARWIRRSAWRRSRRAWDAGSRPPASGPRRAGSPVRSDGVPRSPKRDGGRGERRADRPASPGWRHRVRGRSPTIAGRRASRTSGPSSTSSTVSGRRCSRVS